MQLPPHPQPVEVASRDQSLVVGVDSWGHPTGVQLTEAAKDGVSGAELAHRIMTLYELAKTIALAVRNVEHHRQTGTWLPSWPTPGNVDALNNQLTF